MPGDWKKANVTCIFKKGSRSTPGNYRPVSLTSIVCKLLERNIKNCIFTYLSEHKLLSDCQYGFRDHRSTVLQLIDVLDDWTKALDDNKQVDTIYFDFAKAFDTVPHQRLLAKLKSYGITGNLLSWISSFLSDREQRVVINGCKSSWAKVKSGVPQGSILGPLLFVLYINDLPDCVSSTCKLFADDTKLYRTVNSIHDQVDLQEDVDAFSRWSESWLLRFNTNKCKVLHYGPSVYDSNYQMLSTDNTYGELQDVTTEKDLGINFTNTLNFDEHINKIVNKANSITGLIKRNFVYMDNELFLTLYKALVRPHLDYGNSIYYPTTKKNKKIIENVQRRATRIVPQLRGLSYEDRLKALNLPSLEYRRQRGDMIIVFKIIRGIDFIDSSKLFTLANNDRDIRGNPFKLQKPRANKSLRLNSFTHRVINNWNQLDSDIVCASSVDCFKSRLDKFWRYKRFDTSNVY